MMVPEASVPSRPCFACLVGMLHCYRINALHARCFTLPREGNTPPPLPFFFFFAYTRTGLGLATKLTATLEAHALRNGIGRVVLSTGSVMTPAQRMYERCGYVKDRYAWVCSTLCAACGSSGDGDVVCACAVVHGGPDAVVSVP